MASVGDLDQVDRQLVALLVEDGRRSFADLGQRVGLSAPSVHARIKKLEERRTIERYTVAADAGKLGFPLSALIAVRQATGYHWEQLEQAFRSLPAVEACYSVTGEASYLLRVRVSDPHDLEDLLRSINSLEGVAGTETSVVLSTTFERQRIA